MTVLQCIELPGLRGHHPLGFLAACGLLRSCIELPGSGRTKLGWTRSQGSSEFVAVLFAEPKPNVQSLSEILNWRCEQTRQSPAFTWSSKIDDRQKHRQAARRLLDQEKESESAGSLAVFAALASDMVVNAKGLLRPTMLDLTSGAQLFLKSVCVLAGKRENDDEKVDLISEDAVREALLGPWHYRDDHHALGWDPGTQRLHALRNKLPEKDKANRSVRGAVFLATQALPLFPCFARGRR
ncbi:MAG: type I-G CRISPR-associated protein, Cas3-extension family, partial [Gammaproteobacteria bacterium]